MDLMAGSLVQGRLPARELQHLPLPGANNIAADPQRDIIYALGSSTTHGIQPFTTYLPPGTLAASVQSPAIPRKLDFRRCRSLRAVPRGRK